MSALSFPQLTQTHSKIFLTFTMNPDAGCSADNEKKMIYSHTRMKYRTSQFDMSEMSRALRHAFSTRLTLEVAIYGSHPWVHQPSNFWPVRGLVHHLRMLNFRDRVRFLWHMSLENERRGGRTYDFFGRKNTELNFAHFADGCRRIGKLMT